MNATLEFPSPIGTISISCSKEAINRISLSNHPAALTTQGQESRLLLSARDQLLQYLEGRRKSFDLPLDLSALTPFRRAVLAVCAEIPFGATLTYGQLATRLGKVTASRAVGAALAANPILIVIPCHRVVAGDGSLQGFAGGINIKQTLLELEGHKVVGQKLA